VLNPNEMKPENRTAVLFASATFLIVGVGGYMTTMNPLKSLIIGLVASFVMAYIGYKIGFIAAHPRGRAKSAKAPRSEKAMILAQVDPNEPVKPLTGDETFLDDMGS
jgi:hypothetical protein